MTLFYVQIVLFLVAIIALTIKRLNLVYATIFLIPFQSMGIFWVESVTVQVLPFQIAMLVLVFFGGAHLQKLRNSMVSAVIVMLAPFIISYVYNIFFFEPLQVWEIEVSRRTSGISNLRKSLTLTNITQLAYVIFAFLIFLIFSSVRINKQQLCRVIGGMLWSINVICLIQLITYYADIYKVYEILFYPLHALTEITLHEQTLQGLKRVSGPFIEPSYFGFFSFYVLLFYLLVFGFNSLIKSWAVRVFIVFILLSTSTTAYVGLIVNLGIMYLYFASAENKIYFYLMFILMMPILAYFLGESLTNYVNAKNASTDQRLLYGWELSINAFLKSPIIGHAYGTTRSFFIGTQMLTSLGLVGVIMFLYGLFNTIKTKTAKVYLLGVFLLGLGNFEFTRPEMWLFFGLICNPYLRYQGSQITLRQ